MADRETPLDPTDPDDIVSSIVSGADFDDEAGDLEDLGGSASDDSRDQSPSDADEPSGQNTDDADPDDAASDDGTDDQGDGDGDGSGDKLADRFEKTPEGIRKLEEGYKENQARKDRAEALLKKYGIDPETGERADGESPASPDGDSSGGFDPAELAAELFASMSGEGEGDEDDGDPRDGSNVEQAVERALEKRDMKQARKEALKSQIAELQVKYPGISKEEVIETLNWSRNPEGLTLADLHMLKTGQTPADADAPSSDTPGQDDGDDGDDPALKAALEEFDKIGGKSSPPSVASQGDGNPEEKGKDVAEEVREGILGSAEEESSLISEL